MVKIESATERNRIKDKKMIKLGKMLTKEEFNKKRRKKKRKLKMPSHKYADSKQPPKDRIKHRHAIEEKTKEAVALKNASRKAVQEREDKGWSRAKIQPYVPVPLVEEPKPKKKVIKKKPEPEPEPIVDLEKEKLMKELQDAKDKLAEIEALKELAKEEEAEIIEEVILETPADLAEEEETIEAEVEEPDTE